MPSWPMGFSLPFPGLLQEFRQVGNHLQGHDDFVEVVQVIRGQERLSVDVRRVGFLPVRKERIRLLAVITFFLVHVAVHLRRFASGGFATSQE
jgi:hypothetical protein